MKDVVIIGAGPAGLTAALYCARQGKKVLVLEKAFYGGQIINSNLVENYPGISKTTGYDFSNTLYNQAKNFGSEVEFSEVSKVEKLENNTFKVFINDGEIACKSVIISTGVKKRNLGLEKEEELLGKGISYCATCDGVFFREKDVAVVGGGNTALEDAVFLSEYCNKVYIIHRREEFRGEKFMIDILKSKKNVNFLLNSNVVKLNGSNELTSIEIENKDTKIVKRLKVDGLFIAIGQVPQNDNFSDLISIDKSGYIITNEDCETNVKGIFAAGDCRNKKVRQLSTAVSDGTIAAISACEYMSSMSY